MIYKLLLLLLIVLIFILVPLIKIEHYIDPSEMEKNVSELKQAETKYNNAKKDNTDMKNRLDNLQQKSDKLEDDLTKCRNEPQDKDIIYSESEKKEKKSVLNDYNLCFKEIEELKETTNKIKDQYMDAKEDFDIFKKEYDDLNNKVKDLRKNKMPQIEKDINIMRQNINNTNIEITNYNNKLMLC